jgi:hypothetical protein
VDFSQALKGRKAKYVNIKAIVLTKIRGSVN